MEEPMAGESWRRCRPATTRKAIAKSRNHPSAINDLTNGAAPDCACSIAGDRGCGNAFRKKSEKNAELRCSRARNEAQRPGGLGESQLWSAICGLMPRDVFDVAVFGAVCVVAVGSLVSGVRGLVVCALT